jgi:hypothetical protein
LLVLARIFIKQGFQRTFQRQDAENPPPANAAPGLKTNGATSSERIHMYFNDPLDNCSRAVVLFVVIMCFLLD